MKNSEQENAELAILESAKWVDKVLWVAVTIGITIVLLKVMGLDKFKWQGADFDTSHAWLVYSIISIAHLYASILLIRSLRGYWDVSNLEMRKSLFGKVIASGGLFVRGMVARTECADDWVLYVHYRMSHKDPSAWASLVAFVLIIISIVPFSIDPTFINYFLVAIAIAQLNWAIGSHWVIALSDLNLETESSVYFRKTENTGVRVIGLASGGFAFEKVSWILLPLWFLLNMYVFIAYIPAKLILLIVNSIGRLSSKFKNKKPNK